MPPIPEFSIGENGWDPGIAIPRPHLQITPVSNIQREGIWVQTICEVLSPSDSLKTHGVIQINVQNISLYTC